MINCLTKLNSQTILIGFYDNFIKLFGVSSCEYLKTFEGHTNCVDTIVKLNSNQFVSGSKDRSIIIWNL